jgi:hypothetical protein
MLNGAKCQKKEASPYGFLRDNSTHFILQLIRSLSIAVVGVIIAFCISVSTFWHTIKSSNDSPRGSLKILRIVCVLVA